MAAPTYDTDFYTWTQTQAAALRAKDLAALDLEHLAVEIADLGQAIENAIESHLDRLVLHLLKYRYDPAERSRRGSISRASCIVMVEAPETMWPLVPNCSAARPSASGSTPPCDQNRRSSYASSSLRYPGSTAVFASTGSRQRPSAIA